jgi:hypothetical protein
MLPVSEHGCMVEWHKLAIRQQVELAANAAVLILRPVAFLCFGLFADIGNWYSPAPFVR